jgi:hypothetical protein
VAKIALIQNLFPTLNLPSSEGLSGLALQLYNKFFEVLVEESGHQLQCVPSLEVYQARSFDKPDLVICAPFQDEGNLAPGFAELGRIRKAFGEIPVIVWSNRTEQVIRLTVLEDQGAAAYYTGTLIEAPDELADLILECLKK